jgi:ribose-phosphate pyrophosphokinase
MKTKPHNDLVIVTGNANPSLARRICNFLDIGLTKASIDRFSDGEIRVKIQANVRGRDVFIIQPTSPPVNDHAMELFIIIDALRRASADRITAVVPYFGYARQDRKDQPRVPITAKLIANLLTVAGAGRLLTIDLHAGQIQGFFDIPVDNLFAVNVLVNSITKLKLKNFVVVSPDVGGIKMARAYSKRLKAPLAIVDKRRVNDTTAEVIHIMGEVAGKNAVLIDDMVTTASSLIEGVAALKKAGCKDVYAAVTHPVLAGPALERIKKSPLKKLFATDTVVVEKGTKTDKIELISIAPLLGKAIRRIHNAESLSVLFSKTMESYQR